jgi:glucokinase
VLLGDVGGTNIRLVLKKVNFNDRSLGEIKKEQTIDSQTVSSFEEAVLIFLNVTRGPLFTSFVGN